MYDIEINPPLATVQKVLDRYPAIADKHLYAAMSQSVSNLETQAENFAPVFKGELRDSIFSEVKREVGSLHGLVSSKIQDRIYPQTMEFGRRAGAKMPPPGALDEWVRVKLGVPERLVKRVAFLVGKKIATRGIKPKLFMLRAWKAQKGNVQRLFEAALKNITEEIARSIR